MSGIVWLASYPKSGNTWLRAFLANLRADAPAPVDINALQTAQLAARETYDRAIGWETSDLTESEIAALRFGVQERLAAQLPSPFIKTHEVFADAATAAPRFSLPATHGAIYVIRNPLDVVVSLSHFSGRDIDATIAFLNDARAELRYEPNALQLSQPLADWSTHVKSWVDAPGLSVCVLRYEDLRATPEAGFGRAGEFAGLPSDPARVTRAVAHSRFDVLRRQEAEKGFVERAARQIFFREGRAGGWRNRLAPAQVEAVVSRHSEIMRRFGYLADL